MSRVHQALPGTGMGIFLRLAALAASAATRAGGTFSNVIEHNGVPLSFAVTVPYESLGPELSFDYDERTAILGLRDGFVIAGTWPPRPHRHSCVRSLASVPTLWARAPRTSGSAFSRGRW